MLWRFAFILQWCLHPTYMSGFMEFTPQTAGNEKANSKLLNKHRKADCLANLKKMMLLCQSGEMR